MNTSCLWGISTVVSINPSSSISWIEPHLCSPEKEFHTYPSWRPVRGLDHILVTPDLTVDRTHVYNTGYSDHLPIALGNQPTGFNAIIQGQAQSTDDAHQKEPDHYG